MAARNRLFALVVAFLMTGSVVGCVAMGDPAALEQASQFSEGLDAYNASQYEKAFELLLPVAEDDSNQFSGTAKYVIAEQFELGQGVTQNMKAAISWYKRAAADSNETTANLARYHLGYLYSEGSKVPKKSN